MKKVAISCWLLALVPFCFSERSASLFHSILDYDDIDWTTMKKYQTLQDEEIDAEAREEYHDDSPWLRIDWNYLWKCTAAEDCTRILSSIGECWLKAECVDGGCTYDIRTGGGWNPDSKWFFCDKNTIYEASRNWT